MESGGGGRGGGRELDPKSPGADDSSGEESDDNELSQKSAGQAVPPRSDSNRTQLDNVQADGGQKEGEKLRRRNSGRGTTWTSSVLVPASDIPMNKSKAMAREPSTRLNPSSLVSDDLSEPNISAVPDAAPVLPRNSSRSTERPSGRTDQPGPSPMKILPRESEEEEGEEEDEDEDDDEDGKPMAAAPAAMEEGEKEAPVRMSLMSLLAETDEDGLGYMMDEDEDDDEDDDGGDGGGIEYNSCCVCMVRHKGVAFDRCGHSFCRLCSREMGVQGGNCPLCNNYILEILDIF
ncbi:nucleolin-like [Sesamum indicum]|uniref:Nucleolin-like n=1 Tax=Sesamum indicum TaxID=4182 RepID=A0A6I9TPK2_SESIN|nr:nucleolin-like [Sesamum indicum]